MKAVLDDGGYDGREVGAHIDTFFEAEGDPEAEKRKSDRELRKDRNKGERFLGRATHYRRVATHYRRVATHYRRVATHYRRVATHYRRVATHYRRVATRSEKTARNDMVFLHVASLVNAASIAYLRSNTCAGCKRKSRASVQPRIRAPLLQSS